MIIVLADKSFEIKDGTLNSAIEIFVASVQAQARAEKRSASQVMTERLNKLWGELCGPTSHPCS